MMAVAEVMEEVGGIKGGAPGGKGWVEPEIGIGEGSEKHWWRGPGGGRTFPRSHTLGGWGGAGVGGLGGGGLLPGSFLWGGLELGVFAVRFLTRLGWTAGDRARWEGGSGERSSAQALALRSRIVLAAGEGSSNNTEIARALGVAVSSVRKWRNRFAEHRLEGLTDEPRPGQPRKINDAKVEEVIVKTLETTPKDATHWSTRSMAAEVGLNQTAVHRLWKAFGLQPHRQDSWKLSPDPQFIEKVRDVVGL